MTDNRTTELLPCPFCGGEAYVHAHYSFPGHERKGEYPNYEPIGYAVGCGTFNCRGKRENTGFLYDTEAEAIAVWNTRAGRGECEWILEHSGTLYDKWRCSKCGYLYVDSRTDGGATGLDPNYCPNCGAKVVNP